VKNACCRAHVEDANSDAPTVQAIHVLTASSMTTNDDCPRIGGGHDCSVLDPFGKLGLCASGRDECSCSRSSTAGVEKGDASDLLRQICPQFGGRQQPFDNAKGVFGVAWAWAGAKGSQTRFLKCDCVVCNLYVASACKHPKHMPCSFFIVVGGHERAQRTKDVPPAETHYPLPVGAFGQIVDELYTPLVRYSTRARRPVLWAFDAQRHDTQQQRTAFYSGNDHTVGWFPSVWLIRGAGM
jgi:hypothetical protein